MRQGLNIGVGVFGGYFVEGLVSTLVWRKMIDDMAIKGGWSANQKFWTWMLAHGVNTGLLAWLTKMVTKRGDWSLYVATGGFLRIAKDIVNKLVGDTSLGAGLNVRQALEGGIDDYMYVPSMSGMNGMEDYLSVPAYDGAVAGCDDAAALSGIVGEHNNWC